MLPSADVCRAYFAARGAHRCRKPTILHLVEHSVQGYFASELQALVQVRGHSPLARLYGAQLLAREQIGDQYLYVSPTSGKEQLEERYDAIQQAHEQGSRSIQEISGDLAVSLRLLLLNDV